MKKQMKILLVTLFALCMLMLSAYASDVVMTVNGTEYTDHSTGWSAAVKLASNDTETTVKLFADWEADSGTGFVCPDGSSKNGALYVGEGIFTLDLNGYTLDRNAPGDKFYSTVLYVEDCTFTLVDTSEAKTGTITGGCAEYGGGIYAEDCTLYINGGNIIENKSNYGGGVYSYDTVGYMNGGVVSDNESHFGGGIYTKYYSFTMNDGLIARNSAQAGGGIRIAGNENLFTMNGGIIEENYSNEDAGGVSLFYDTEFVMNGGIIRNNTAFLNGGGVATYFTDYIDAYEESELCINGGSIIGNVAQTGNGGGVFWDQTSSLYLTGCTITGNSAPKGYGGGVYFHKRSDQVYFAGKVTITDNTAVTDRSDNVSNFFAEAENEIFITLDEDLGALNADSTIGLSFGKVDFTERKYLTYDSEGITSAIADCFISDDTRYLVNKEADDEYFDLYLDVNPDHAFTGDPVFTVETEEDGKVDFFDRRDGWAYVLEKSKTTDVKLTLHSDWIAGGGSFNYYSVGTYDSKGVLYIPETCENNITIDLNGYNIDRNRTNGIGYGGVIYMDTPGSLTLTDSSEEKTGKITGGNTVYAFLKLGRGGGIYVDFGTLYLKGVTITGNMAEYGGAVYCDDQNDAFVYIQDGTKIYGNIATEKGGGIYMENGYLYLEDGEIRDNEASKDGAGIYWDSDDDAFLIGGKIYNNHASGKGDGMYVSDRGYIYLGGDIQITDNDDENLYLAGGSANISNANGQEDVPNKPLTKDAKIGITSANIEEQLSASDSMFAKSDYKRLYSDDDRYYIRAVYDEDDEDHVHKIYINTWTYKDVRYPSIGSAYVKNSNLLKRLILDNDKHTITLIAHNTKRNFFETISLYELIECNLSDSSYYIDELYDTLNLCNDQEIKVVSDNGTYEIYKVTVIPQGGEWAAEQENVENPYRMIVSNETSTETFTKFSDGWEYAVSQETPATVTLFADWIAPNGGFKYSVGTEDGCLYLDEDYMDITIDLNGNTINRNLSTATSYGRVFTIEGGAKLRITDNSPTGTGKITGAYNDGDGGAFYIDYGELHINGGEISGNKATNGGAIYSTNENDSFVYINGGKITKNVATEEGGAIFMEEGFLYVDGGEISGNYATCGGGIYWNSENKLVLTGGVIKDNTADEGAGVYATDWGDMYIGGTIMVINNYKNTTIKSNFYISDTDAYLNNAAGQTDVPNKPLTDGASVYISAASEDFCISDSNSRFTENSANYLYTDYSSHIIRTVYNANGGNHSYKLYYNNRLTSNVTIPGVKSVEGVNSCINSLHFNHDDQYIDLRFDIEHRDDDSLKDIALSDLVSVTFDHDGTTLVDFDTKRDFTKDQEYMVLGSDGTYALLTVYVEWDCTHPSDGDGNGVCDVCGDYIRTAFAINRYEKDSMCTVLIIPEAGTYTVMFVDYEDGKLKNVDFVERTLSAGFNAVYQEIRGFKLEDGDKIMLMSGFMPLCKELVVE